ncbi:TolB family protein [Nonomuraea sp. NPDC001831]|uniref:TolB family protein n=1 Tax=Nonomuraea sp. NPDC001831 TaxID=3364340 RepID=UPI0036853CDF
MRSEKDLTETLRAAADHAPDPGGLLAGVEGRRRRRRRRRTRGLAVVTAVAAVLAAGTVMAANGRQAAAPSPAARPFPQAVAVPLERAWPQAVVTMPGVRADGLFRFPVTTLDATRILVVAGPGMATIRAIEVYDTTTRTFREITGISTPPGMRTYRPQPPAHDGLNLAWHVNAVRKDGTQVREIWTVPLAGGEPRQVAAMTGEHLRIERIALDGDRIVWSERTGGVWWMPLAGGAPTRFPGSDGLHLVEWPWASDVADGEDRNQTRLVNLSTGRPSTRDVVAPPDVLRLRCGPSWCRGVRGGRTYLQRLDGGGAAEPPGLGLVPRLGDYPALDRFVVSSGGAVYDVRTGTLATSDRPGIWWGHEWSAEPAAIVYWAESLRDGYRVLNLAAVPPAQ